MSLLDDIASTALDPDYTRRAPARRTGPRGRRRTRVVTFLVLVVPGLLLAIAVAQAQAGAPALARQHERLVATIKDRGRTADQLQRQATALRGDVGRLRRAALTHSREGRAAQRRLTAAAGAAARTPATGDGVRVTVDDAAQTSGGGPPARVYDRDLQTIVNGLWAAGATAIAVNGQRVTSTTAIREAGSSILVDFRPISPPYTLNALGDPDTLSAHFADSPAGRRMQTLANTFGIRYDIQAADDTRLPAAARGTLRYAKPAP
jgi:uncharacterized protein YlxW (UPF0749 family)